MKRRFWLAAVVAVMSVGLVFCGVGQVMAKVAGQCAECHTMHNSQGNSVMAQQLNAAGDAFIDDTSANEKLLIKATCLACHTGTNGGTNVTPFVFDTSAPTYGATGTEGNTLAGGSFYFVENGADTLGHNVKDLPTNNSDGTLTTPPGFDSATAPTGLDTTWTAGELTCAGTNGCHGDHSQATDWDAVAGAHHSDDGTIDGSSVPQSYRFLDGIIGYEDSDWEYQPDASAHNQYYGVDRTTDEIEDDRTISALCAQCHGDFHSNGTEGGAVDGIDDASFGASWIRHPSDFDLASATGTEYASYNGGDGLSNSTYSVVAPVGSSALDANGAVAAPLANVSAHDNANDDTIVTCISCHRAHGTEYPDLLRWNYANISADSGAGNIGCFICHTSKD